MKLANWADMYRMMMGRSYELVVCQQPLHARMCGFGEKDRRPIDPPPIVKLVVKQEGQKGPVDVQYVFLGGGSVGIQNNVFC